MEPAADHVDRTELLEAIAVLTGCAEALVEGHTAEQLLWLPTPPSVWPRAHETGSVQPTPLDPERLLAEFREARGRLAELIRSSEGLDLARIRMRSPVIPILRFHVAAWSLTCVQHDRRHMAQAERVAAQLAKVAEPEAQPA